MITTSNLGTSWKFSELLIYIDSYGEIWGVTYFKRPPIVQIMQIYLQILKNVQAPDGV